MEGLLGQESPAYATVKAALRKPENNRLFKARHWVNARDAKSARLIRDKIRSFGFPTPDLEIFDHSKATSDPFKPYSAAPYVISMGLRLRTSSVKELGGIRKTNVLS